jgi:hypothetical protein
MAIGQLSATVAIDTTRSNFVQFTFQSANGGNTWTFYNVVIRRID